MTTDPYRHTCACGEHDLTEVLTRTSDTARPDGMTPHPDGCPHWGHSDPARCGICTGASS